LNLGLLLIGMSCSSSRAVHCVRILLLL